MLLKTETELINEITKIVKEARKTAYKQVNTALLSAYWNIGKTIVEYEQHGAKKAPYGKEQMLKLSKELTKTIGKGFSLSNLHAMRRFYLEFEILQALPGKLSWTHYCELMAVADLKARAFYQSECEKSNWSSRELRRQIDTSLFERLLLSDGQNNKQKVLELSKQGISYNEPDELLKTRLYLSF